jgi:hypothetical protein
MADLQTEDATVDIPEDYEDEYAFLPYSVYFDPPKLDIDDIPF